MALNSYQWQSDRTRPKKTAGVHKIDAIQQSMLTLLKRKLDATNVSTIQTQNSSYDSSGVGKSSNDGQVDNFSYPQNEQANYMNNYQRNNNPYSKNYTPAWRNQPNIGLGGNNNSASRPNNFQPQQPQHHLKGVTTSTTSREEAESRKNNAATRSEHKIFHITKDTTLKNQATIIHNLEIQWARYQPCSPTNHKDRYQVFEHDALHKNVYFQCQLLC